VSFRDLIGSSIAPLLANLGSVLLRSPLATKSLWDKLDHYVSFRDIRRSVKTRFGAVMTVSTKFRVENEIYYFGEWEPLLTRYLLERPPSSGVFLDVGANIGYFSLLAAQRFSEVHAIEASPSIARRLRDNIDRNGARITVHECAVGDKVGSIDFYLDESQSGGSSIFPGGGRTLEASVPVVPFARLLDQVELGRIEFIKIDVEGSEVAVLSALREAERQLSPSLEIVVEYDPARNLEWAGIEALMSCGFQAYLMQGSYDRDLYVNRRARSKLFRVNERPDVFCDILLRR
jgi:FkbM family methyltransferase